MYLSSDIQLRILPGRFARRLRGRVRAGAPQGLLLGVVMTKFLSAMVVHE